MKRFKRILVGLDQSEMDKTLIKFVAYLADIFEIEKVYFMHIAKSLDLPNKVTEKYPDLLAPVDETITKQIQNEINLLIGDSAEFEYSIEVREGNPTDSILRWSEIKEIDLMLMGQKHNLKGKGLLPGKLVKLGHCSVMFVPENMKTSVNKILVPLDFSSNSKPPYEIANNWANKTNTQLYLQHTYHVPTGYHTSGKSYEEFAEIMKKLAEEELDEFIGNDQFPESQKVLTNDKDRDVSEQVEDVAEELGIDLVIAGSRGRSGLASILLGSVAEKICHGNPAYATLIVKDKKENMSLIEAILRL